VRRSLLVLPLVLAVATALAGCGTGETSARAPAQAPSEAPAPGDLAADAVAALERVASAHYALDASFMVDPADDAGGGSPAGGEQPVELHVEGDASADAGTADITVEASGQRLAAKILVRDTQFYVNFMGAWYGGDLSKYADARDERRELATPERVRKHFEEVFTGTVQEGPLMDGRPTWSYTGTLDSAGLVRLADEYGRTLSEEERAQLEELARAVELRFLVGKEDALPRRIEVELSLGKSALDRSFALLDELRASAALRLSDFGKPVEVDPPAEYRPLEELARQLFSGLA
jgi:hypothetical protein